MMWVLALLGAIGVGLVGAVVLLAVVVSQTPVFDVGLDGVTPPSAIGAPVVSRPAVPVPTLGETSDSSAAVESVVAAAMTWLSPPTPYRWGGCSRSGVDCSCFVQNALLAGAGIRAPRVTVDQIHWATPVPVSQMRRGDLIFFHDTCTGCGANPTHVAMYLGGGQFIHAGDPVQISSISGDLFRSHFQAAGRPIGF